MDSGEEGDQCLCELTRVGGGNINIINAIIIVDMDSHLIFLVFRPYYIARVRASAGSRKMPL